MSHMTKVLLWHLWQKCFHDIYDKSASMTFMTKVLPWHLWQSVSMTLMPKLLLWHLWQKLLLWHLWQKYFYDIYDKSASMTFMTKVLYDIYDKSAFMTFMTKTVSMTFMTKVLLCHLWQKCFCVIYDEVLPSREVSMVSNVPVGVPAQSSAIQMDVGGIKWLVGIETYSIHISWANVYAWYPVITGCITLVLW